MRKFQLVVAVVCALVGSAARAQGLGHQGFFFHLELGPGYLSSSADGLTIKGGGGSFVLALGGSITETLVFGGEVWDLVATNPKVNGVEGLDSNVLVGIGPTLRAYIDPRGADLFVSVTPSLTRLTAETGGTSGSTKMGFGARFGFGKEWRPAQSRWGFGVAGQIAFSSNEDEGPGAPTINSFGGGVNFSVTMN